MSDYYMVGTSGGRMKEMMRNQTGKRSSSSSGKEKKSKGPNCKTSPLKKFIFTSPKAHKRKDYEALHKLFISKAGTKV